MVNISWINDQIAISGAFPEEDISYLKDESIDAIVDLRSEYIDNEKLIKELGIQFLHIDIDDRYSPTFKQLEEIFNFVEPILDKGKKVLIHCQNGCGRSPLVATAILAKRGMEIANAIGLVKDKHPKTAFTNEQRQFVYLELEKFLKSKNR